MHQFSITSSPALIFCMMLLAIAGTPAKAEEEDYVKKTTVPGRDVSQALSTLTVHPDLEATLFASEPMMLSPSSIDADSRGRVWVCEVVNYRRNQGKRPEGDRILILEDSDGDGVADKSTVFYQGNDIDSAHGICVLGDRALVSAGEDVFYLVDDDGDDKADRKELLFTKTGSAQHDHNIHAVHFGPDGRLYFNFGNASTQLCDKDGTLVIDLAGNEVKEGGGHYQEGMVFRCELDGSKVETLGWNFRNNWEVCVDSFGTIWQSDNDDDGNQGVRINYVMEFGNYGYNDEITGAGWRDPRPGMHEEIPMRHWHLNDPGVVPNLLQTGAGSPTGMCFYEGDLLPEEFRGQPIHCDAGPNVCRAYVTQPDGAGYKGEIVDILTNTADRWFRPSDVTVAPDGSLFVADWYDPGVGGHGMGDIEKGRIFRVTPKGHSGYKVPGYGFDTPGAALEALLSANEEARYLAWKAFAGMGSAAEETLEGVFTDDTKPAHHRARALWLLARLDASYIRRGIADSNPDIRITALRAARQMHGGQPALMREFIGRLAGDADRRVLRECSLALRFDDTYPAHQLWAELAARHDGRDRWYLEALGIGADLAWDGRLARYDAIVKVREGIAGREDILWRSRAATSPERITEVILEGDDKSRAVSYFRALHFQPDEEKKRKAYLALFREGDGEIALAAAGELGRETIESMPGAKKRLDELLEPVRGTAKLVNLASRLGLTGFDGEIVEFIEKNPDTNEAVTAAKLLLVDPAAARELLRGPELGESLPRARALALAFGKVGDRTATEVLAGQISRTATPPEFKRELVSALAMSNTGGKALLKMAREDRLPEDLHFLAAAALSRSSDPNVRESVAKIFNVPAASGAESLPPLGELVRLKGNAKAGKAAFVKATCNTCHRVMGEGIDFGPDLTGIGNKLSREALLEAVLYPSNAISHGFHGVSLTMESGDTFVGYITGETKETVTLHMAGGVSQEYKAGEIRKRSGIEMSLMPPGLAAILEPQELADLVAYLQSLK